jgi:hypothetical protein
VQDKICAAAILRSVACLAHVTSVSALMSQDAVMAESLVTLCGSKVAKNRAMAISAVVGISKFSTGQASIMQEHSVSCRVAACLPCQQCACILSANQPALTRSRTPPLTHSQATLFTNVLKSFEMASHENRELHEHAAAALMSMTNRSTMVMLARISPDNIVRTLLPFKLCNVRVVEYGAAAVFQLARAQGKRREMNEQGAVELVVGWVALLLLADSGRVEDAPGVHVAVGSWQ